MRDSVVHILHYSLALLVLASTWSCGDNEVKYHNTLDKIEALSNDNIEYEISALDLIGNTKIVPVIDELEDTIFYSPIRSVHIKSFPCNNCHNVSLSQLQADGVKELQKAHWEIEMKHASDLTMNCSTCHADNNLEQLTSLTNQSIEIDQSHLLCGQCHSSQYKDWKGGAHGKSKGGWMNPRISYTCVNCHNPHKPAFLKRWPSRLNTVKIKELDR